MILRVFLAPASLALVLGAVAVAAQPGGDEAAATATAEQPGDDGASTATGGGEQPAGGGRAPSDYRPSEQISEDLSVSFPVDI